VRFIFVAGFVRIRFVVPECIRILTNPATFNAHQTQQWLNECGVVLEE